MTTRNAISELCELVISLKPSAANECELDCIVELRLAPGEVDLGDEACAIAISKLTLFLDLEGAIPVPKSRLGEPFKPLISGMDRVVTQKKETTAAFNASAKAKVNITGLIPEGSASAGVKSSMGQEAFLTAHDRVEHYRVKALPNLRWEISEPDESCLNGTYLDSHSLIRITRTERANRTAILARATVKQRDVEIDQVTRNFASWNVFGKFNTNQRRMFDIFIAKSLDSALRGRGKYVGEITLSSADIELPDEE